MSVTRPKLRCAFQPRGHRCEAGPSFYHTRVEFGQGVRYGPNECECGSAVPHEHCRYCGYLISVGTGETIAEFEVSI